MASEHKDPNMLRKYVHEDLNSRLSTPNIISSSIVKDSMEKATAEDKEEWVDEDLELFKRSRLSQKNHFSSNAMSTLTALAAASDKVETENQESAKQGNPMMPNFKFNYYYSK